MPDPEKQPAAGTPPVGHKAGPMVLRAAAEVVQVLHVDVPPKITKPKRIHARRVLPFVREGQERAAHSLNTRAIIRESGGSGEEIQVVRSTPLTQPGQNHVAGN